MPRIRHLRLALVAVLILGTTVMWLRRETDEDAIRGQLTRLAKALHTTDAQANPVFVIPRLRSEFDAIFDEMFHVSVPELHRPLPTNRRELAAVAAQVTATHPNLVIDYTDVEIKLDDARTTADVAATVNAAADIGGERTRVTRPVNFLFFKRDGAWKITSITVWEPSGDS
jgi:hypothetical protein